MYKKTKSTVHYDMNFIDTFTYNQEQKNSHYGKVKTEESKYVFSSKYVLRLKYVYFHRRLELVKSVPVG